MATGYSSLTLFIRVKGVTENGLNSIIFLSEINCYQLKLISYKSATISCNNV